MQNKAFVKISCKAIDNCCLENKFKDGKIATGEEIHQFLMRELELVVDLETKETIPGDYAIWYLGCEIFGELHVNEVVCAWTFGESSWARVVIFLNTLYQKNILTIPQYVSLIAKLQEGLVSFDAVYEIAPYLKAKRDGIPWKKKETPTKRNIKEIISSVKCAMEEKGYRVIFPR